MTLDNETYQPCCTLKYVTMDQMQVFAKIFSNFYFKFQQNRISRSGNKKIKIIWKCWIKDNSQKIVGRTAELTETQVWKLQSWGLLCDSREEGADKEKNWASDPTPGRLGDTALSPHLGVETKPQADLKPIQVWHANPQAEK